MDFVNWVMSTIGTGVLLAFVVWAARNVIVTRLAEGVKAEYEKDLEKVRSALRSTEAQAIALQGAAMSGLIGRQAKSYERRLQAVEQLWAAVNIIGKGEYILHNMAIIKFSAAAKGVEEDVKLRGFFKAISGKFNWETALGESTPLSQSARPFVTPLAWSYFNAYSSIVMQAVIKSEMLQIGGEGIEKLIDSERLEGLIKTVMPQKKDYLEKYGDAVYHYMADDIKDLLLGELRSIVNGEDLDKENTDRAASILHASNEVMASTISGAQSNMEE